MPAPPLVRRALRRSGRRVLPVFLAPKRHDVEERPGGSEGFEPAARNEMRAVDILSVAQEYVEPEAVAAFVRDVKVAGELRRTRVPRPLLPAVALAQSPDVRQRRN